MKNICYVFVAVALLQACALGDKQETTTEQSTFYRDSTITAANAYSDLFLDSNSITSFVQQEKLDDTDEQKLRNFYMVRNNQFAWFTSQGLTEEGRSFWAIASNGGDSSTSGVRPGNKQESDSLLQKDSIQISSTDTGFIRKELALTNQFIKWAETNKGSINAQNMYYVLPRKKMDALELADSVLNRQKDSGLNADQHFAVMKQQLEIYYQAAKNGGWQPVTSAGLKKGSQSPAVTLLKKRLQATNDYAANDTSNIFSDSLVTAIKDLQQRNGLAATGSVNDSLLAVLNVPAVERVQQLLLNMNRMKWMQYAAEGNRIEVNLPSQMLYVYENNNKIMEMPVIIGKGGASTVAFSGRISEVVFSPEWNLPASIVRNEIMPKIKADPGYLKKKNMVITGGSDSMPVIKQLAGKDNPLGRVKFLFPNTFDIYLHDTPDKSQFQKQNRALSHGCIRVANAEKLAQYLLKDQEKWTAEKIREAMNSNKEQNVSIKNAEPVQINYFSAWVDTNGKLNFRNDINGRDKATYARLFTNAAMATDVATSQSDSLNTTAAKRPAKQHVGR
jgi:murein L,D-transpeptidase YcbB/YkuD